MIIKKTKSMKWLSLLSFGSMFSIVFIVIIYDFIPEDFGLNYREMINLSIFLGILISVTIMYPISRIIKVDEDK